MQESKQKKIEQYLIKNKTITSLQAIYKFNCTRLAVVINRLRSRGWIIETNMQYKNGENYALYRFIGFKED